jgi:hypothetical protein
VLRRRYGSLDEVGISVSMQASGIIRLSVALGLSFGVFSVAPSLTGAALAQTSDSNGLFLLSQAVKAYESGDYKAASDSLNEAFQIGLSKELSARAILLRAQINERSGALARALQDYSNALWMDTLPQDERKKASEGKQRVIAAMGLNTPASPAPGGQAGVRTAGAQSGGSGIPQASAETSSGGVLRMFGGLFESSKPAPVPQPEPAAAEPRPAWQTVTAEAASPVVTRPKVAEAVPAKVVQAPKPKPVQSPVRMASLQPVAITQSDSASGAWIVFGEAPSEPAGRVRARQIKAQLADILVSREVEVAPSPDGKVRVVAGPYKAKAAALALCSAMQQRGVACQVTP